MRKNVKVTYIMIRSEYFILSNNLNHSTLLSNPYHSFKTLTWALQNLQYHAMQHLQFFNLKFLWTVVWQPYPSKATTDEVHYPNHYNKSSTLGKRHRPYLCSYFAEIERLFTILALNESKYLLAIHAMITWMLNKSHHLFYDKKENNMLLIRKYYCLLHI
jgi:hypothetical protein